LRFGLEMHPVEGWVEYSQLAEKVGFDYLWHAADHSYADSGSALMLLALRTKRIKLGVGGNSIYLKHPVLIASATALIDEMSEGRAVTGLVSAGFEVTLKLGMDTKEPLTACREAIEIIRALWTGGPINYKGEVFTLRNVEIPYKARPDIPIYLGTRGSKFELVGEMCDGTFTHGKAPGYVERMLKTIAVGATKAGRNPEDIETAISLPFKITRSEKAKEMFKKKLKPIMTSLITGEYSMGWVDSLGFNVDEIKLIKEAKGGKKSEMVDDRLLDRLIDAFAIVGTAEECIDQIEELERAGIKQVIPMLEPLIFTDPIERRELIISLGREIIPSFKEHRHIERFQ
jgi:5,10-methylenetetrahydromethanopterin reductase